VNPSGRTISALTGTGGGSRQINAVLNNQGTLAVEATLTLGAFSFTHASGAVLRGSGTLDISAATTTFAGDIEPGAPGVPGLLTITGSLTLQSTSSVNVDIDGYTVGSGYDRLAVSGNVTLGGTLNLNRDVAFIPDIGTVFSVMTYGSRTVGIDFATTNGEDPFPVAAPDRRLNAGPATTSYNATVEAYP